MYSSSSGWVAQLAGPSSVHQKVVGLISSQGTYLGCEFDLQSGRIWEATDRCPPPSLPPLSLPLPHSSKVINISSDLKKCTAPWFLAYTQTCSTMSMINFRAFLSPPKRTPCQLVATPHFLPTLPILDNHSSDFSLCGSASFGYFT